MYISLSACYFLNLYVYSTKKYLLKRAVINIHWGSQTQITTGTGYFITSRTDRIQETPKQSLKCSLALWRLTSPTFFFSQWEVWLFVSDNISGRIEVSRNYIWKKFHFQVLLQQSRMCSVYCQLSNTLSDLMHNDLHQSLFYHVLLWRFL